jgi:raffinose/stachyose/melibiose transport system permease protein
MKGRHRFLPCLFMTPAILFILFVYVVPFLSGLFISLTDWTGFGMDMRFIGLRNYAAILGERVIGEVMGNMAVYFVLLVAVQNALALLLALLIDARPRGQMLFRALAFLPTVTASVAVAYSWALVLDPLSGPLTAMFRRLGAPGLAGILWLGDSRLAIFVVAAISLWHWTGWNLVVYYAGLHSIPPQLLEAASMDGAAGPSKLFHVTIPMLAPAFTVNIVVSTIGVLKIFDLPYILTGGGPGHSTESLTITIYSASFMINKIGYGTALSFVLFLLVLIVASIQTLVLRRAEENIA